MIPNNTDRLSIDSKCKTCATCNKLDVCMYSTQLEQLHKEIKQIHKNDDLFDINITCKKWSSSWPTKDMNIVYRESK